MELDIRGLGLEPTPVLRRDIERRLRHGLRRFDSRIDRVTVRLVRDHGRGRHAARRCQVTVEARGLEPLRVAESARTLEAAFSRAASRTKRELARALGNHRRVRRGFQSAGFPSAPVAAGFEAAPFPYAG